MTVQAWGCAGRCHDVILLGLRRTRQHFHSELKTWGKKMDNRWVMVGIAILMCLTVIGVFASLVSG